MTQQNKSTSNKRVVSGARPGPAENRRVRRIVVTLLVIALVVSVLLYAASVWMVGSIFTHRVEIFETIPAESGLRAETIHLTAADGTSLQAWWMPAKDARVVVILLHGMDGMDASSMLGHAHFLHDAGYATMEGMMGAPPWLVDIMMPWMKLGLATRYGAWPSSASALADIPKVAPRPVLLMHGSADEQIPMAHARRLADAAGRGMELWIVEGTGHGVYRGDITDADNAPYGERILSFLKENL